MVSCFEVYAQRHTFSVDPTVATITEDIIYENLYEQDYSDAELLGRFDTEEEAAACFESNKNRCETIVTRTAEKVICSAVILYFEKNTYDDEALAELNAQYDEADKFDIDFVFVESTGWIGYCIKPEEAENE